MSDIESIIEKIREAFSENEYPGDDYLQGSDQGCEPYEQVGPFRGKSDWRLVEADFLDAHSGAIHFFSEAGFRFFLPAYLIADVQGRLLYAEPLFSLAGGFFHTTPEVLDKVEVVLKISGGQRS